MGRSAWSEHRSELETPCALRLGEPNQDGVTSDVLCRTASLTQELLSRLRQNPSALHLAIKRNLSPAPRQTALHNRLFKAAALCTQDAFRRLDVQPRG